MKIVYPNGSGGVAVIHRSPYADDAHLSDHEYAAIAVPNGVPYLLVSIEDFPLDGTLNELGESNMDKTYREAWEADFSNPDGYGGQA